MNSINNVYNWGKIYKSSHYRWKSLYPSYIINNEWNNLCIKCNKEKEIKNGKYRWCNNCYKEYNKLTKKYSSKAYNLIKNKNDEKCQFTGCNYIMLKYYFESLFDYNMNWNNQSIYWQIDHRIPISWFNLEDENEVNFVCNYKNIQPMEKILNICVKNNQYPTNNLFNISNHHKH